MAGVTAQIKHWWGHSSPAGYQPGVLLQRLQTDLGRLEFRPESDSEARIRDDACGLEFQVREHVEAHFMMYVVTTEFSYRVPGSPPGDRRVELRHRGNWRREGVECVPAGSQLPIDRDLEQAMLPLDFTRFELIQDASGWLCRFTHYGASEVVYRVPPIRRYIRMSTAQLDALRATFMALRRLLADRTWEERR